MKTEVFIQKANQKHGGVYDYSDIPTPEVFSSQKVLILCKQHGKFIQQVNSHLLRSGCPKCALEKRRKTRMKPRQYYIDKCISIHNGKYDYANIPSHPKATDFVEIGCPDHGSFFQRLNDHLTGHGCNKCARQTAQVKTTKGLDHFLILFENIHGNRYDYTLLPVDTKRKDFVNIVCKKHGTFNQMVDCHLAGSGCPLCSHNSHTSKPENEIQKLLDEYNIKYISNVRNIIPPKELDIYLPDYKIAIEYCGLYWHSETCGKDKHYHKDKFNACNKQGIRLLTIFEDEWVHNKNIVIKKLLHILQLDNSPVVYARKCKVCLVDVYEKQQFFEQNHIQGDGISSINIALKYAESIVAVMGFMAYPNGVYYLTRYATCASVIGGFSKLLSYFKKQYPWTKIISFADLRWSIGQLYANNGFTLDKILMPDYSYCVGNTRSHKFNYRRKHLPRLLKTFDPTLSEKVNCNNNGILRIWDCGKQRWVLNKDSS